MQELEQWKTKNDNHIATNGSIYWSANTVEKGRDLWMPSSYFRVILSFIIEISSLHVMASDNGEEIQCQSSQ